MLHTTFDCTPSNPAGGSSGKCPAERKVHCSRFRIFSATLSVNSGTLEKWICVCKQRKVCTHAEQVPSNWFRIHLAASSLIKHEKHAQREVTDGGMQDNKRLNLKCKSLLLSLQIYSSSSSPVWAAGEWLEGEFMNEWMNVGVSLCGTWTTGVHRWNILAFKVEILIVFMYICPVFTLMYFNWFILVWLFLNVLFKRFLSCMCCGKGAPLINDWLLITSASSLVPV